MKYWEIVTAPNPTAEDQTPFTVTEQQKNALDKIGKYLHEEGKIIPIRFSDEPAPIRVYVGKDGRYAGEGAQFGWEEAGTAYRGWVLADGTVTTVEKDVVTKESEDPCEVESYWKFQPGKTTVIRVAAGMKARPFM